MLAAIQMGLRSTVLDQAPAEDSCCQRPLLLPDTQPRLQPVTPLLGALPSAMHQVAAEVEVVMLPRAAAVAVVAMHPAEVVVVAPGAATTRA